MKTWRLTQIIYGNGHWSKVMRYVQADSEQQARSIGKSLIGEVNLCEQMPDDFRPPAKMVRDDLGEDAKAIGLSVIEKLGEG